MSKFFARSASNRDPDWHWWFVALENNPGRNELPKACMVAGIERPPGAELTTRESAEYIAQQANLKIGGAK